MTSVTCPRCKKESFNRNDIAQKYCSSCKLFWSIDKARVQIILDSAKKLRRSLLAYGEGIVTASEFNCTISAIHDLEVLLTGLETDQP